MLIHHIIAGRRLKMKLLWPSRYFNTIKTWDYTDDGGAEMLLQGWWMAGSLLIGAASLLTQLCKHPSTATYVWLLIVLQQASICSSSLVNLTWSSTTAMEILYDYKTTNYVFIFFFSQLDWNRKKDTNNNGTEFGRISLVPPKITQKTRPLHDSLWSMFILFMDFKNI